MKLSRSLLLLSICLCFPVSVAAQKFLEKPYQKWSKDDALKILNSSAWAQTYQSPEASARASAQQIAREQAQTANSGGNNPRSYERNFGLPPIVIRLHSALPIRQAMIRTQQIAAGYDKMDEKQKADFDAGKKGYLDCAICKNYYVITITQFANPSGQSIEEGIFQRMTFKDLGGNVWLENEKGEKRELAQFTPPKMPGDSAIFFFARKDDKGNSFLTSENKEFKFVFKNEFLGPGNPYANLVPRNFEFKVSKIMIADNIEF
jgi:hypothetical protein